MLINGIPWNLRPSAAIPHISATFARQSRAGLPYSWWIWPWAESKFFRVVITIGIGIGIGVSVGIGISVPIAVGIGVSNSNGILVKTLEEKLLATSTNLKDVLYH